MIRECLEEGISPRCHLEDITRADIYGYVVHKDTCLLHANLLYQTEVIPAGTDPAGDLRKCIASLHTLENNVPDSEAAER